MELNFQWISFLCEFNEGFRISFVYIVPCAFMVLLSILPFTICIYLLWFNLSLNFDPKYSNSSNFVKFSFLPPEFGCIELVSPKYVLFDTCVNEFPVHLLRNICDKIGLSFGTQYKAIEYLINSKKLSKSARSNRFVFWLLLSITHWTSNRIAVQIENWEWIWII